MKTFKLTERQIRSFWSKTLSAGKDDCWEWSGALSSGGYGSMIVRPFGVISSHRLSWLIHFGAVPNAFVCHTCDNPKCVNPNHLFLGTHQDNMTDKMKKGRHVSNTPSGESSHLSKLTKSQVVEIRGLNRSVSQNALAKRYRVCRTTISHIQNNKNWKGVS